MTKLLTISAFAVPAGVMLALAQPCSAAQGRFAAAANAAATAAVQEEASGATRVCVNFIPDTGSRMARRVCRTKAEWLDAGVDFHVKK